MTSSSMPGGSGAADPGPGRDLAPHRLAPLPGPRPVVGGPAGLPARVLRPITVAAERRSLTGIPHRRAADNSNSRPNYYIGGRRTADSRGVRAGQAAGDGLRTSARCNAKAKSRSVSVVRRLGVDSRAAAGAAAPRREAAVMTGRSPRKGGPAHLARCSRMCMLRSNLARGGTDDHEDDAEHGASRHASHRPPWQPRKGDAMSVYSVIEIIGTSSTSWEKPRPRR